MEPRTREERFRQYKTDELVKTVQTYQDILPYMGAEHQERITSWVTDAKEELTVRLIAGEDYATNRPDEQGG